MPYRPWYEGSQWGVFPSAWEHLLDYTKTDTSISSLLANIDMSNNALDRFRREIYYPSEVKNGLARETIGFYLKLKEASHKRLKELNYQGDLPTLVIYSNPQRGNL